MRYKILVIFIVIFGHLSVSSFITQLPTELKLIRTLAKESEREAGKDKEEEENENESENEKEGDNDEGVSSNQVRMVNVSTPTAISPKELPTNTIQNPMLLKTPEIVEVKEREMNSVDKINQFTQAENIQNLIKQNVISNPDLGTNLQNLNLTNTVQQGKEILEGTGLKTENLFGIFKIQIPVSVQINPITGEVITTNKSFWNIILDYLSF